MASRYQPSAARGSLAALVSTPSRPPQQTYVVAPSSTARSMAAMVFWRAYARTRASLLVKAPSRHEVVVVQIDAVRAELREFADDVHGSEGESHGIPKRVASRVAHRPEPERETVLRPGCVGVLRGLRTHVVSSPNRRLDCRSNGH